ncbi:MAG: hypothetical protein RMK20_07825 [Verrucomicrobiales bacterium]|nr:hypothetical protein [Verrucomicrobiales bacterium]
MPGLTFQLKNSARRRRRQHHAAVRAGFLPGVLPAHNPPPIHHPVGQPRELATFDAEFEPSGRAGERKFAAARARFVIHHPDGHAREQGRIHLQFGHLRLVGLATFVVKSDASRGECPASVARPDDVHAVALRAGRVTGEDPLPLRLAGVPARFGEQLDAIRGQAGVWAFALAAAHRDVVEHDHSAQVQFKESRRSAAGRVRVRVSVVKTVRQMARGQAVGHRARTIDLPAQGQVAAAMRDGFDAQFG